MMDSTFLKHFLRNLGLKAVAGDQAWGLLRLVIFSTTIALIGLVFTFLLDQSALADFATAIRGEESLAWLRLGFRYLRYILPPLVGASLAFAVGAFYLKNLYRLDLSKSIHYLYSSLFGLAYPRRVIGNGKKETQAGDSNSIDVIGGPGYMDVQLGSAVIYERLAVQGSNCLSGISSVQDAGSHFLRRFETIRDTFSLEEQHRCLKEVPVVTKDGIPLILREVEATFRIRPRPGTPNPVHPYPMSRTNVYRIADDKKAFGRGDWQDSVMSQLRLPIVRWVAQQNLDAITAPIDEDPRQKLRHAVLSDARSLDDFAKMGVELLWVSFGHIDNPSQIDVQRLANWKARWQRDNRINQANAEALQITYKAQARAEVQANTLRALSQALQETMAGDAAESESASKDRLSALLLMYLARIIESMTEAPGLVEGRIALPEAGASDDNGSDERRDGERRSLWRSHR